MGNLKESRYVEQMPAWVVLRALLRPSFFPPFGNMHVLKHLCECRKILSYVLLILFYPKCSLSPASVQPYMRASLSGDPFVWFPIIRIEVYRDMAQVYGHPAIVYCP